NKLANIEHMPAYFESLGIPQPEIMAWVAALTELVGGILLLGGLAVRWIVLPLMVTMAIAATSAHWDNGWHVLPETELTMPWEWRTDLIEGATERKAAAKDILRKHGNYTWLTETGSFTILKNGIEFAATYFLMLLALFFIGAGNYLSLDYWIARRYRRRD
ncbi:MAG: DoxX family protein, partial [Pseudomonadota bacterium]